MEFKNVLCYIGKVNKVDFLNKTPLFLDHNFSSIIGTCKYSGNKHVENVGFCHYFDIEIFQEFIKQNKNFKEYFPGIGAISYDDGVEIIEVSISKNCNEDFRIKNLLMQENGT